MARIAETSEAAVRAPATDPLDASGPHHLEVVYRSPTAAYVRSFYPGACAMDDRTVAVDADDYFDVLRALIFLVGL